jgi:glycosyltransferase involved in cell wall biosynthesis
VTAGLAPSRPAPASGASARVGEDGEGLVIVTEQLAEFGGVERILQTLLRRYPRASVLSVSFAPRPGFGDDDCMRRVLELRASENGCCHAGGEVRLVGPGGHRHHFLFPLYARHIGAMPLDGAETVLSLGGMGWSAAATAPPGRHVAYFGGPPRPLYDHSAPYLAQYGPPLRSLLRAAMPALRSHHRRLLRRPSRLAANSRGSAAGLSRVSGRPVAVVYPPVRTSFFTPAPRERTHFLAVSRLMRHKRLDVIVEAFRGLGARLVVAGGGPELERMRAEAPRNVHFAGHVGDDDLRELYRSSRALVSASVEEFGLCLAEAQAVGIPVIAPRTGGGGEIVRDGRTGILLDQVEPAAIAGAVQAVERLEIQPAACQAVAERFSEPGFLDALGELLERPGEADAA